MNANPSWNLRGDRVLHGLWRIVPSPMFTEVFAQSGLDFQILDCEHGAYDYATLLPDILACERHGCAPVVRVSGTDKIEVQRCLDLGARGLVFPQLTTPESFARAGAMMDYAPVGTRGFNPFVRAGNYGAPAASGAAPRADRPWFIPIIETLEAAKAIDAVAAIDRIDLVYIGVYDLSAQLGCPGKMDAPELTALVDQILAACASAGTPVALMALNPASAMQFAERGVQALVHGVDSHRVAQATTAALATLHNLRVGGAKS
jgi:2-keto-3-deoxy-L-rhamnonate aldolase RhmA